MTIAVHWFVQQIGIPWYAHAWPQLLVGAVLTVLSLSLFQFWFRRVVPVPRWLSLSAALMAAFVAVAWDVWLLGRAANQLCRAQGGLHVYRTVETDGFIGTSNIAYWSKYGFSYVEVGGGDGRKYHISLHDGEPEVAEVHGFQSRYGVHSATHEPVVPGISRSRYWIGDVETGAVLGELITFTIERGWVDRRMPFEHTPWICGDVIDRAEPRFNNHFGYQDLVKATLKPR